MDQRTRQAALYFLRNISLDGQPPQGFREGFLGAEAGSEVAMTTHQQYSSITTAIVHSSGAEDQTWSDSVPTSLPVDQESMDSEAQAASDISSLLHRHPPSDAAIGRLTPAPQRELSGSPKKQTHSSSDSQGNASQELQRTR